MKYIVCLFIVAGIFTRMDAQLLAAGYKNIRLVDSSRIYKKRAHSTGMLYYRPVEIDTWYPAVGNSTNAAALPAVTKVYYGDLLQLLEDRSNRFQDDTSYHTMSSDLLQYICTGLQIKDPGKVKHLSTNASTNAPATAEELPLIVYMCAFNGMSYENVALFESLAAHGYLVACISSIGRYPGNMGTSLADVKEMMADAAFAIQYFNKDIKRRPSRIGVIGYSWGGLAGLLLAQQINGSNDGDIAIKAFLSFDGSEMHYYREEPEEDAAFDSAKAVLNAALVTSNKMAYTYLESGFKQAERPADSIYNPMERGGFQKNFIHFNCSTHEDFSYIPSLKKMVDKNHCTGFYDSLVHFTVHFFDAHLKDEPASLSGAWTAWTHQAGTDTNYTLTKPIPKQNAITGLVTDASTGAPLAFANIGVPGKNAGTVTAQDGSFTLKIDSGLLNDSFLITSIGYAAQAIPIKNTGSGKQHVVVPMVRQQTALPEVVVSTKLLPQKVKGNTSTSMHVSVGLPLKFLGAETGIRIALGNTPVLLKQFSFNINDNRLDTAVFRMNIYRVISGVPAENILTQNIFVAVGKQTGLCNLDLTKYKIVLQGDILLSLEWVEGARMGAGSGAIFLSAGFLNGATWHRLTSQAAWTKAPGLGVGFNLTVQPLKR